MEYYLVPLSKVKINDERRTTSDQFTELDGVYSFSNSKVKMVVKGETTTQFPGDHYSVKLSKYKEFISGRVVSKTVDGVTQKTAHNIHFEHIENFRASEAEVRGYLTELRRNGELREYTATIISGLDRARRITKIKDKEQAFKDKAQSDSIASLSLRVKLLNAVNKIK